ncbi:MAG: tyrosine-protein phosphatase [Candidatus Symbiothrix sp.]|jgi:protein-tyrosine phosphatase|nr:tyrosine-protein phosphatase [Candidatus Symbiothrix sp.]
MIKRFLPILFLVIPCSCIKEKPDIHAVCELTPVGTYLIKWEIYPPIKGTVKIYASSDCDSFNLSSPITEQNIAGGYKSVLSMPSFVRTYFKLVFNKKYSIIVADRIIPVQRTFNCRDMGGYSNKNKKQTKWGKLYRSGTLSLANTHDINILRRLKIKTIIDFRTERDSYAHPLKYKPEQVFNLPLRGSNYNAFFDEILSGKMKRNDIITHSQDVFSFLLENNSDYFIKMFDILLDENNYPLVFFCSLGKDRSAIAAALILAALDMDRETILNDYLLSNDLINFPALVKNADSFEPEIQETITALFSANREFLVYALDRIDREYGSLQTFLEKELQLTGKKREKLKSLLLYD